RPSASAPDDFNHVAEQRSFYFHGSDLRTGLRQHVFRESGEIGGIKVVRVKAFVMVLENGDLVFRRGIADLDFEQEAVQLCFRQRISAFKLDWILRGEDSEKLLHVVRYA